MPISRLTDQAASAIRSSVALNDATTVIKELIDNALDARATIIAIEVSTDALDIIQVRDNGLGIGVEDRQLLCKRGYTSKISTLEDLACLGGKFLGFRGEALASVAELSTSITITTRVDGELSGSMLRYGSDGKLVNSASASHPVGTTIRVSDFLHSLPVRKQTAIKTTAKVLLAIRRVLHTYAFARPTVRFSFKVLKSKGETANWTYAPSLKTFTLHEIATKIVGKEVVAKCQQHSIQTQDIEPEDQGGFTLTALLASPDSDFERSASFHKYVSIDGRPLDAEKAPIRDLVKLYKSYLQRLVKGSGKNVTSSKAFLCLRIECPNEAYDVNIEPAKDQILFADPSKLVRLFVQLLKKAYGELEDEERTEDEESAKGVDNHDPDMFQNMNSSFDYLLASKPTPSQAIDLVRANVTVEGSDHSSSYSISLLESNKPSNKDLQSPVESQKTCSLLETTAQLDTHSAPLDSFDDKLSEDESSNLDIDNEEDINDPHITNPWSLAKMNARIRPKNSISMLDTQSGDSPASSPGMQLLSPAISPQSKTYSRNPGPPLRSWQPGRKTKETHRILEQDHNFSPTTNSHSLILKNWIQPQTTTQPYISPVKSSPLKSQLGDNPEMLSAHIQKERLLVSDTSQINPISPYNSSSQRELEDILDFERKKKSAVAQYRRRITRGLSGEQPIVSNNLPNTDACNLRAQLKAINSSQNSNHPQNNLTQESLDDRFGGSPIKTQRNPHHNRYLSAVRNLSHPGSSFPGKTLEDGGTGISPDDQRLYFIKHRNDSKRLKTNRLPLESILPHTATYNSKFEHESELRIADDICPSLSRLAKTDSYPQSGRNTFVQWSPFTEEVNQWQATIKKIIKHEYRADIGDNETTAPNLEISLARAIKAHNDERQ